MLPWVRIPPLPPLRADASFDQSQFVHYQLQACFGLFFSSLWLFFWVRAPRNTTGPLNLHPRLRPEPSKRRKLRRGVACNARDLWRAIVSNAHPALYTSGYCQQRPSNKKLLILALVSLCCGSCALPGPGQYAPFGPNDHAFIVRATVSARSRTRQKAISEFPENSQSTVDSSQFMRAAALGDFYAGNFLSEPALCKV
jgi:hypothetical protein